MKKIIYFIILFTYILKLNSQSFLNPSLDGNAGTSAAVPPNWILVKNSNFNVYAIGNGSSPDIMPGAWGVNLLPSDGNAYVGMICRSNGTWESMGHELTDTLKANECYSFTIDMNWKNSNYAGYNKSCAKLRIWGIDNPWSVNTAIDYTTMELLWEAGNPVSANQWQTVNVNLNPTKDIKYLIFDAHWFGSPYAGNILIDNISNITKTALNINLGSDATLCKGNSLLLDASNQGAQYLWSNGSTNSTLNVTSTGNYAVTVSAGACLITDDINVNVIDLTVNLGADVKICKGDQIILDAFNQGAQYLWSDGSTNSTLNVTLDGNYSVTVTDGPCTVYDDINVNVIDLAADLGPDISICQGDQIILDAFNQGAQYLWSDGSTNSTLNVTSDGNYSVTVTDGPCTVSDDIQLSYHDAIVIGLPSKIETCPGVSVTIDAGAGFISYLWSDNSTEQTIQILNEGIYSVSVTDLNNCSKTDSSDVVFINCKTVDIFIPNAFTPNGDLLNDKFIIDQKDIEEYHLMIFNRWGKKVFETYTPGENWDGKHKGGESPAGVYIYILDTKTNFGIEKVFKGDVTLLR